MAALRQELRYGLCCDKISKNSPKRTIYHVKLTDTAIRTLEAYQNLKASLPNQPAICFKGNQGYVKIPVPTPEAPDGFRVFSFYLSSDSKDKPQSSFDCIHQYVSGEGRDQLEGQGSIQDKITVCATDDSYQTTRERMSQVEKDIWSRTAIEIKPGPSRYAKFQRKQVPVDATSKQSPNKRSLLQNPVAHRPLRERIIHLLALKPYKKPEILLWLERERAGPKDKAELMPVLEEVGKLNPKDQSYSLKDEYYRHVQKDWAGYVEEEKQLLHRLLIRKLQPPPPPHGSPLKTAQTSHPLHKSPGNSPLRLSPAKNLSVKRPLVLDSSNVPSPKKLKVSDPCLPPPPPLPTDCPRVSSAPPHPAVQTKVRPDKAGAHLPEIAPALHSPLKLAASPARPKADRPAPAPAPASPALKPPQHSSSVCTDHQPAGGQHKKKKSKKHKEKERQRLKADWIETSPDLKQNQENLKDHEGGKTSVGGTSPEELPDYLLKYKPIVTLEQRQQYSGDYCAEYDEYRALHDRIGAVTEMFVQLGLKINTLSSGTQEYKLMEEQILQKYRKYKKKFPGFQEEKKRCEYLHKKLSHIKSLIEEYNTAQGLS